MATVRFSRLGATPSGGEIYSAEFRRVGGAGAGQQLDSAEMLVPRSLPRGVRVTGTDRDAPRT